MLNLKSLNTIKVKQLRLYLCMVVFLTMLFSDSLAQGSFSHRGWRFSTLNGINESFLNSKDSLLVDSFRASLDSSFIVYDNVVYVKSFKKGMIQVSLDIENANCADTGSVMIYVNGSVGDSIQPIVSDNRTIQSLLKNNLTASVLIKVPFDTTISKATIGIYMKGKSSFRCRNIKFEVLKGEYSETWEQVYKKAINEDPQLSSKIQMLSKVWGCIKYFSPKVSAQSLDWDSAFINGLEKLFRNGSRRDLNYLIRDFFALGCYPSSLENCESNIYGSFSNFEKRNVDFGWFKNSTLLDRDVQVKLSNLVSNFEPFVNKYVDAVTSVAPVFF